MKIIKWIKSLFSKSISHEYTPIDDISYFLDKSLIELDKDVVEKGVNHLRNLISNDDKEKIKIEYEKSNDAWWALYHHGWGTSIRNSLRDNVCRDDKLPSGNWDDYYIQLVEIACGIRK